MAQTASLNRAQMEKVESEGSTWNNPYMQLGPFDLRVYMDPGYLTLTYAVVGGSFVQNGDYIEGVTVSWFTEADDDYGMATPEQLCDFNESFGFPECVECPFDADALCWPFAMRDMTGERIEVTSTHPETGEQTTGVAEATSEMVEAWEAGGFCP